MRKILFLGLFFMMLNVVIGGVIDEKTYILTPEENYIKIRFPDLTKEYSLKDEALKENKPVDNLCEIKTTVYGGDGNIFLKSYQNITKERLKESYDCNCKDIEQWYIDNKTKENKTEIINICETCYIYENYIVSELIKINPETFKINKNTEIYEVFEGCSKIEKLNNGKWGCSLWSEVNILGTEIKGATWWNVSYKYKREIKNKSISDLGMSINGTYGFNNITIWFNPTCENVTLYYNNYSDYTVVCNDSLIIYFETEGGGLNNSVNDIWGNNIVSVWHFGEGSGNIAKDSSINSNDGTSTGATWNNSGLFNNSINFDGSVSYINCGSDSSYNNPNFTLIGFVNSNINKVHQYIFRNTGVNLIQLNIKSGYLVADYKDSSGWGSTGNSNISMNLNEWYLVALTFNGSEYKMYINDNDVGGVIDGDSPLAFTGIAYISYIDANAFSGSMDEMRIYNRTLSFFEIKEIYNNSINLNNLLGDEEQQFVIPNCSIQVTPSNILANSTGNIEILLTCEHFSGINKSRFMFTNTLEGFVDIGTPNVFSIRPPENNRAVNISDGVNISENILVAGRRNLSRWFEYTGIFTDIFSYSARIENDRGVIITNTSTSATFNLTIEVEESFRNMVYLDREKIYESPKNNYTINKNNPLLVKFWEIPILRQGDNVNFTAISFRNLAYSGNPVKNLLTWYCNSSYNPIGSIKPTNSSNCVYTTAITTEVIDTISYTALNSSYNRQYFGIINGKIAGIQATSPFYVYFESDVTGSQHYYARYTTTESGTNVSFNESKTAWSSTDDGTNWNQINGTIDMWVATITDVDQLQFGVYVESNTGTNYTNLSFYTDDVGYVNFPISIPTVKYYCQGTNDTCLYGEDWDLDETYNETMAIHMGASIDPNAVGTVNHSVYLCYLNGSVAYTINNSIYSLDDCCLYTDFNTSLVPDGNYKINITARADDNYNDVQSIITFPSFEIDNIPTFPVATYSKRLFFYPDRKFYYQ